jgi:ADP-heptose:LPS heptosyltransferase
LIRNEFPDAHIMVLTNIPVESRAAPLQSVLQGAGLVDGYLGYPVGLRRLGDLLRLGRDIFRYKPDLVIYLVSRRNRAPVIRDYCFYRVLGIRQTLGFPFARSLRRLISPQSSNGLWESEAARLARRLAPLGDARPDLLENWSLCLSAAEMAEADGLLADAPRRLLGLSIGTKQTVKDWGGENWRHVLEGLGDLSHGLVLIGAEGEKAQSDEVAKSWPGPVFNFCGKTGPRISAALMTRVELFLCHDSGPMHLAAAAGTRCVAVFGNQRPPGQWFPCGPGHAVIYPASGAESIESIRPEQVVQAARRLLSSSPLLPGAPL